MNQDQLELLQIQVNILEQELEDLKEMVRQNDDIRTLECS